MSQPGVSRSRPGPVPQRDPREHAVENLHVAPLDVLASMTASTARSVVDAVFKEHKRADRAIASSLRTRHDLAMPDQRFIAQAVFALFRWHGWIDVLHLARIEERLLLAWLLDAPTAHPACRVWAQRVGRNPDHLGTFGDAPNWTARAEGLKRWTGGRSVNADPWRLFPGWLREVIPPPQSGTSVKAWNLEFLDALQRRPALWVRAQGAEPKAVWAELQGLGLKPWVHRRLEFAAKLPTESDVHHLLPFTRGQIEIHDLASQAVGLVCDPDPGERWWDACAGAGGKALHLASLMHGKGVVVATDSSVARLKEAVRRARRSPFRNITTKVWSGKHVAGKPQSFDGVLVDAPCTALGTWRRNPDARWTTAPEAVARLAETQFELLQAAAAGVKPGGSLVYSVCTITPAETTGVVQRFLSAHPAFQLDPFAHPLADATTDGTLLIWPQEADCDAMFIARMIRVGK